MNVNEVPPSNVYATFGVCGTPFMNINKTVSKSICDESGSWYMFSEVQM